MTIAKAPPLSNYSPCCLKRPHFQSCVCVRVRPHYMLNLIAEEKTVGILKVVSERKKKKSLGAR